MDERIAQLEARIAELLEWKAAREKQFIPYPLDMSSKAALGAPTFVGNNTSDLTQEISLSGLAQDIDVPAAYVRSVIMEISGEQVEFPSLR
jgi:hypothetical protein